MNIVRILGLISIAILLAACAATAPSDSNEGGSVSGSCSPAAPRADSGLDPFYAKACEVGGIPIVAAAAVPDEALIAAAGIVAGMLEPLSSAQIRGLRDIELRVGVIGAEQVTTDMPEYSDLDEEFPETDWDERSRGLGATVQRPLTSSGEENLLCYEGDRYLGENILVHEFGHTVKQFAVQATEARFAARVTSAYDSAMAADLWTDTYAASNAEEYWAEGVQSYFGVNGSADPPNGVHNSVDTRSELEVYDSALYDLVDEVFGGTTLDYSCP